MFNSVASSLSSLKSLETAPQSYTQDQLDLLQREAQRRVLEYIESTPPAEYGVHPLGFLNIPLFESSSHRIRVHIWYGALFNATSPYKIHDHSYSSYSVILAGRLRNVLYRGTIATDDNTRPIYSIARATPGATSATLQRTGERVNLDVTADLDLARGSAYGMGRNVFHYAHGRSDFVATLYFHLRHPDSTGTSRVAIPLEAEADGPSGKFQYDSLTGDRLKMLKQAVIREIGP